MRIEHQLFVGGVIEYGHLVRANDYKPLLLDGVEPTHENMRGDTVSKPQPAESHVDNARGEVALPFGFCRNRLLAK